MNKHFKSLWRNKNDIPNASAVGLSALLQNIIVKIKLQAIEIDLNHVILLFGAQMRLWENLTAWTGNLLYTFYTTGRWENAAVWGNVLLNVVHWIALIAQLQLNEVKNPLWTTFKCITALFKNFCFCLFCRTLTLLTLAAAGMMDWPSALSFTRTCLLTFPTKSSTVRTRQVWLKNRRKIHSYNAFQAG